MKTAVKNLEKITLCSTLLEQHKYDFLKKNFFACHPPFKSDIIISHYNATYVRCNAGTVYKKVTLKTHSNNGLAIFHETFLSKNYMNYNFFICSDAYRFHNTL